MPVSPKMLLVGAAAKPVEMHVHGLGLFGLDGVSDNTKDCGVVSLNGCGWLWMAHFYEEVSLQNDFMCIYVEHTEFGLCCQGHNGFDDLHNG